MTHESTDFGRLIEDIRRGLGWTQGKAAEELGMTLRGYSDMIRFNRAKRRDWLAMKFLQEKFGEKVS